MVEIKTITVLKEKELLEKKLNDRFSLNLSLNDDEAVDIEKRRFIASSACADDFKFFCDNFGWIQNPQTDDSKDKDIPFLLYNSNSYVCSLLPQCRHTSSHNSHYTNP